jgi:hypothetical protein
VAAGSPFLEWLGGSDDPPAWPAALEGWTPSGPAFALLPALVSPPGSARVVAVAVLVFPCFCSECVVPAPAPAQATFPGVPLPATLFVGVTWLIDVVPTVPPVPAVPALAVFMALPCACAGEPEVTALAAALAREAAVP